MRARGSWIRRLCSVADKDLSGIGRKGESRAGIVPREGRSVPGDQLVNVLGREGAARIVHQEQTESPRLLTAIAQAKNVDVVLRVVDESLARAAEARKQREKEEAERKEKEDRDRRAEEFDRREKEAAAELADRNERVARDIAREEAEASARRRAVENQARSDRGLDLLY